MIAVQRERALLGRIVCKRKDKAIIDSSITRNLSRRIDPSITNNWRIVRPGRGLTTHDERVYDAEARRVDLILRTERREDPKR